MRKTSGHWKPLRAATALAVVSVMACDVSASLEEPEFSPKEEVVGTYTLRSVEGDRISSDTAVVIEELSDTLLISRGEITLIDTIAFQWKLWTLSTRPPPPGDRRQSVLLERLGEWSLSQGDDEKMISLLFSDGSAVTALFVNPSGRVPTLTLHSYGVPWVYRKVLPF